MLISFIFLNIPRGVSPQTLKQGKACALERKGMLFRVYPYPMAAWSKAHPEERRRDSRSAAREARSRQGLLGCLSLPDTEAGRSSGTIWHDASSLSSYCLYFLTSSFYNLGLYSLKWPSQRWKKSTMAKVTSDFHDETEPLQTPLIWPLFNFL